MSHVTTYNTWVRFMEKDARTLINAMKDLGDVQMSGDAKTITFKPKVGNTILFTLTQGEYIPKTDTYMHETTMKETMNKIQQRYKAAILGDILKSKNFIVTVTGTEIKARRY